MKSLADFLALMPAYQSLNLRIISTEPVTLCLPYDGNTNHHGTMFGGSLSLGATLAGWSAVHEYFPQACGNIVIKHGDIRYLSPAQQDVIITATLLDTTKAVATLSRFGKCSVITDVTLRSNDAVVAVFRGEFGVFLPNDDTQ